MARPTRMPLAAHDERRADCEGQDMLTRGSPRNRQWKRRGNRHPEDVAHQVRSHGEYRYRRRATADHSAPALMVRRRARHFRSGMRTMLAFHSHHHHGCVVVAQAVHRARALDVRHQAEQGERYPAQQ